MKNALFIIFFVFSVKGFAQDNIYLRDGSAIKAKVSLVNETNITYKKFENLSGPDYVLSRSKVAVIVYENGTHEVYTEEESTTKRPLREDPYLNDSTFGKNLIGINYFDIIYGNITLHYERLLFKKQAGIKAGFSLALGNYSNYMGYGSDEFHAFVAFNYYPLKQRKVNYFCGPMILAGQAYGYFYDFFAPGNYGYNNYFGVYVNNGLMINITKNFSFSTVLGLGLADRGYGNIDAHANFEINTNVRF